MRPGILLAATALILISTGCHGPKGKTAMEKRQFVDRMARETLSSVYEKHPEAQRKIENAAGYGVFSDFGYALVTGGGAHGYGVIVDNDSGLRTYMRMLEESYGVGIGVKDFRSVFVFHDQDTLDKFVTSGWEVGAEAAASSAKGNESRGGSAVGTMDKGMEVHHITEKGFFVRVAVHAAKYYPDKKLNIP